jgi:hypothetical protein
VLDYLSLLIAHSARSFLSFHPIPVFSLLVPTSESRHHFSLSCTLSPQVLLNFLCHTLLIDTPSCILYLESRFFDSLPYFLLVDVFIPFTQLYIHSSSFCSQSFHFFTGIPVPLVVLLPLSPCPFSFLSSIPPVSCTLPFHPFCPQLCRSLFRFHSQPIPLTLFPHYVTWCFSVHS